MVLVGALPPDFLRLDRRRRHKVGYFVKSRKFQPQFLK